MKWPYQPMHQDFRVAGWVDQGEQLIKSTLSSQGARGQWEELIILCKEKHYPKPSWSSGHGVIHEDRGSSSWPPWGLTEKPGVKSYSSRNLLPSVMLCTFSSALASRKQMPHLCFSSNDLQLSKKSLWEKNAQSMPV